MKKKTVTRLAFLTLDETGEITDLELTEENTILIGSFGERHPAKISITYSLPTPKKRKV
jgi:hypothetical protein